MIYRRSGKNPN